MAGVKRLICPAAALQERGAGVRFLVFRPGAAATAAFVVRFDGLPRAYLNRCAHLPVELDWQEGQFFDNAGLYLVCATHGATYLPNSGRCAGGPCRGGRLEPLQVVESDGGIYLLE